MSLTIDDFTLNLWVGLCKTNPLKYKELSNYNLEGKDSTILEMVRTILPISGNYNFYYLSIHGKNHTIKRNNNTLDIVPVFRSYQ